MKRHKQIPYIDTKIAGNRFHSGNLAYKVALVQHGPPGKVFFIFILKLGIHEDFSSHKFLGILETVHAIELDNGFRESFRYQFFNK